MPDSTDYKKKAALSKFRARLYELDSPSDLEDDPEDLAVDLGLKWDDPDLQPIIKEWVESAGMPYISNIEDTTRVTKPAKKKGKVPSIQEALGF